MNILLVAYYFPPLGGGGVQRSVKFAKYLHRLGCQVEVLTIAQGQHSIICRDFEADLQGIPIHRVRDIPLAESAVRLSQLGQSYSSQLKRLLMGLLHRALIPDKTIGWVLPAIIWLLQRHREHPYDVIYTTGPDHSQHLVGLAAKQLLHYPWVADFRDPWTTRVSYQPPTALHRMLEVRLERKVVEAADAVILATDTWRREFCERHPQLSAHKFHTIYNGYDPDDFRHFQLAPPPAGVRLVHLGSLYARQDPTPFLRALAELRRRHPDAFNHIAAVELVGSVASYIADLIGRLRLDGLVNLVPYTNHQQAIAYMQTASHLLLLVGGGRRAAGICPGKVGEYLITGLPLFVCAEEGEVTRIARRVPHSVITAETDVERIETGLFELCRQPLPGATELDPALQSQFNRAEQAGILRDICRTVGLSAGRNHERTV